MSPTRMCAVCRKRMEKDQLFRICRATDGKMTVDISGKAEGRGAYICKTSACIKTAQKRRALERAFSCAVDDKLYEELAKLAGGTDE